jgi:hypothetical protein
VKTQLDLPLKMNNLNFEIYLFHRYTKILMKDIDVVNGAGKSDKMRLLNIFDAAA